MTVVEKYVWRIGAALAILLALGALIYLVQNKDIPETIHYNEGGPRFVYENGKEVDGKSTADAPVCNYDAPELLLSVHKNDLPCGGYYVIPEFGAVYYNFNDTSWLVTRNVDTFTMYPDAPRYGRDQSHVYFESNPIPYADPESFQPLIADAAAQKLNAASSYISLGYDDETIYEGTESFAVQLNGQKPRILVTLDTLSAYLAIGNKVYYYARNQEIDGQGGMSDSLVFKLVRETKSNPEFELAGENPNTNIKFYIDQEGYFYFDTGRTIKY
ncbi:MAG: hypothetical protein AB202_01240 [Parcubacteria bacterium C7867-007]|nr:MAG: hypothetical protein AB202_01240 [Parcubacteria bacterium C7867-007]